MPEIRSPRGNYCKRRRHPGAWLAARGSERNSRRLQLVGHRAVSIGLASRETRQTNGTRYFANTVILIRHKAERPFAKLRCLIAINRVMTGSGQLTLPRPARACTCARARTYGTRTREDGSSSMYVLNGYTRARNMRSRRLELAFLFPDINFGATMRGF